jgi:hypothetical protein
VNLAIPDIRTLEIHLPPSGYLTSCRRSYGAGTRNELGVPLLESAIRDAAALGYNFLAIAGEQSISHTGLSALCREAHRMRMLTTLTTRAGLLTPKRIKSLVMSIDLLGIRYEAGMAQNLDPVRKSEIPFALVYHLTAANMGELEPAAAFAVAQGAAMLQVVPAQELADQDMATVWMVIECLRDMHREKLAIQLDVLNRYNLRQDPARFDAWVRGLTEKQTALGDLITPLVIQEDGLVVPLQHGFPLSQAMGFLGEAKLEALARVWIRDRAADFCQRYRRVLTSAPMFADLRQLLARSSKGTAMSIVMPLRMATGV